MHTGHPALLRMWEKPQRGYRAMGHKIRELTPESAGMGFSTTANDGKQIRTEHYNLPAVGLT